MAQADTKMWKAPVSGNWSDATKWSSGRGGDFAMLFGFRGFAPFFCSDALGEYVQTAAATDNRGSVTVSVTVPILVVPLPQEAAVAEMDGDDLGSQACFMGQIDAEYVLQGTVDLTPPISWVSLSTNTVPEPLLRVTDADAVNHPFRFYRFVPHTRTSGRPSAP